MRVDSWPISGGKAERQLWQRSKEDRTGKLSRQGGRQESWLKERSRCTRRERDETDVGKVVRRPGRGSPCES